MMLAAQPITPTPLIEEVTVGLLLCTEEQQLEVLKTVQRLARAKAPPYAASKKRQGQGQGHGKHSQAAAAPTSERVSAPGSAA